VFECPGDLRKQDHVAPAGNARVERDPAGVPAHHLQHHHSLVAGRRRVEPVERVGRRGHGRIEAEGEGRAAEIVVDRLGHAHHGNAMLVELLRDAQRSVAPDTD